MAPMSPAPNRSARAPRLALAFATLVVAGTAAGCGGTSDAAQPSPDQPTPVPTPSAARQQEAKTATATLRSRGALLAGVIDPKAVVTGIECTPRVGGVDLVDCQFGQGVGGEDPSFFAVRVQADGTLTKALGEADPVPGHKSAAQTAALLAADDRLQHAPSRTRDYRCRPSSRIEPDGRSSSSAATGQLCTTYFRVSRIDVRRYVEFAPDGTALRDYLVHDG